MVDIEGMSTDSSSSLGEKGGLVSFVLVTYNQESCVEQAVKGALIQTYSPLEIVLSDDCSPDGTFDVIKKLVEDYDGPHKIILNRNEENLGIATHFGKAVSLTQGGFVVVAAGDDTSLPQRTEMLVQKWVESDKKAKVIISNCLRFNDAGDEVLSESRLPPINVDPLMSIIERSRPKITVHGAVSAYDMDLFRRFDKMIAGLVNEDRVLLFRCFLLGGRVERVDDPLVLIQTGESTRQINVLVSLAARVKAVEQHLIDLGKVGHLQNKKTLVRSCEKRLAKYKAQLLCKRREMTLSECENLCGGSVKLWLVVVSECVKRFLNRGIYQASD